MNDIANRIKILRTENDMTQKELADKLGVSQNAIYNWENGKREPNRSTLERIAETFEVSPGYIMGWCDTKNLPMSEAQQRLFEDFDCFDMEFNNWISKYANLKTKNINILFDQLNEKGQDKAVEQVELLTKIPEYRKDKE